LLPLVPLSPNTAYTVNVTGVLDITGNAQTGFLPPSFTTGLGTDLVLPTIVSSSPAAGTGNVAVNTAVQVVFSKAVDPASFDPANSFALVDSLSNIVPATVTFSPDYTTATLQPKSNLAGGGAVYNLFISYFATVYDLAGNRVPPTLVFFTTQ
jgi:Bacterial Ig-like domain